MMEHDWSLSGLPVSGKWVLTLFLLLVGGGYLAALASQLGQDVLTERLSEAFDLYRERASSGQVAADFPAQYLATLEAAAATISVSAVRDSLARIISEAAN